MTKRLRNASRNGRTLSASRSRAGTECARLSGGFLFLRSESGSALRLICACHRSLAPFALPALALELFAPTFANGSFVSPESGGDGAFGSLRPVHRHVRQVPQRFAKRRHTLDHRRSLACRGWTQIILGLIRNSKRYNGSQNPRLRLWSDQIHHCPAPTR